MRNLFHGFQSIWIIAAGLECKPGEIPAPVFLMALHLDTRTVEVGRPKLDTRNNRAISVD